MSSRLPGAARHLSACRRLSRSGLRRLLLVLALIAPLPALAHPHARFSYQLSPVLSGGAVVALKVKWLLDPLTSLIAMRGLDLNRNGVADPEELEAFARQNDALVAANAYFLTLATDHTPVAFTVRQGLKASLVEQRIHLDFEVALASPLTDALSVRLFDESWFVALTADDPPVPEGHPCQGIASAQALATQGWGSQPVPIVRLSCRGA